MNTPWIKVQSSRYSLYGHAKIDGFETMKIISDKNHYLYLKIREENGDIYMAKISKYPAEELFRSQIINYSRSINILQRLNHPCIQRIIDFKKSKYSLIITDFSSNGTLHHLLKMERNNNQSIKILNDTTKLIIIYGIASGMSYLHSHNIIHRDLNPKNIVLDDRLFPKITGFDICKEITKRKSKKLKGTPIYLSPEVYDNKEYGKSSDVYSFSLLIYEIMTSEVPFDNFLNPFEIMKAVKERGWRPYFNKSIPNCYRELIEKCWSQNPKDRPTFDEIIERIKTDKSFITETVNEEEFLNYVQLLEESEISFDSSRKDLELNEIVILDKKTKIEDFYDFNYSICFDGVFYTEANNISLHSKYANLYEYSPVSQLLWENMIRLLLKKLNSNDDKFYAADFYTFLSGRILIEFSINVNISSKLNHPAIREFVGYSIESHKDKNYYLIYGKTNTTLLNIIEKEQKKEIVDEWNDTKKLINIYGIASAMSYLHSNNIIYNNLNLKNIHVDEYLFPKIDDFSNSIELNKNEQFVNTEKIYNSNIVTECTAPERYTDDIIGKTSDVYAFAIIMYQIMSCKTSLYALIIAPLFFDLKFDFPILDCYRNLIEKCWARKPEDRPTFDDIVTILKTDKNFITETVDETQYYSYIEYIEKSKKTFNLNELEVIKSTTLSAFNISHIDYDIWEENKPKHLNIDLEQINLDNYKRLETIGQGAYGKVYKIIDKKTDDIYVAKTIRNFNIFDNDTIINIEREITNLSKADFPSVLKFIGYNSHDFKKKEKPTIITEFASNGSLDKIIDLERKCCSLYNWNDTKKLINIYGIAAGMEYLHSIGIIHRDLKPANIFLDDNLFPKIGDFGLSKEISPNQKNHSGFKGTPLYCAPETNENEYSPASDVYAFSIIVYEIVTNSKPYSDDENKCFLNNRHEAFLYHVSKGCRPKFEFDIPHCYRSLIEKCWSGKPEERLTFKEIVNILETNPEFITDCIDKGEYFNYVASIKEYQNIEFNSTFISKNIKVSNKLLSDVKLPTETIELNIDSKALNLKEYELLELICKGSIYKVYKIEHIKSRRFYAAKMSSIKIVDLNTDDLINLSREIKNLSKLDHPSILKFIGYSPVNFKGKQKPVIITEFAPNISIDRLLNLDRKGHSFSAWDDTKKLINIYGIASGMKYLHSKKILHRDLKPSNVLLDEYLFPKIGDFGLSVELHNKTSITFQSEIVNKGTAAYIAPEIYIKNEYTEKSDVFAFAFLMYEIMTLEIPFNDLYSENQVRFEIINKKRPSFKTEIPSCCKKLIESCWSHDACKRPTFESIVDELENNQDFLTNKIKKEDYFEYINHIKSSNGSANEKIIEHL